jgi:hypothetical protein
MAGSIELAQDHVTSEFKSFPPLFCYCADDHSKLSQDLPYIK